MLAILRDQGLEKYVKKTIEALKLANAEKLTKEEVDAILKWKEGDANAHTCQLAIQK